MVWVRIQWTETASNSLAKLPRKVRRGLLDKANELRDADDPAAIHKPLVGPLQGYYRITYGRYRAIYRIQDDNLANGDTLKTIVIQFVVAGIRKEGDKRDVYRFARKLIAALEPTEPEKPPPTVKPKPRRKRRR